MIETEFHKIGPERAPYLIAEIGLNHNGDLGLAKRCVDAAASSGASAAKFQMFDVEHFISKAATLGDGPPGSLGDFFRQFELKRDEWRELAAHVRAQGLDFLCSIFDEPSLALYQELEGRAVKIASADINNRLLLEAVRRTALPVFLSTGASDDEDIKRAFEWLADAPVVLFQCVSAYPAKSEDYNLSVLSAWQLTYGCPVGLSDHCPTNAVSLAALALGACAIEKHFTLDAGLPGPDQRLSLEPAAFRELADGARAVFESLGDGNKRCRPTEEPVRKGGRRSLHAARALSKGKTMQRSDFIALRPGGGLAPDRYPELVGREASRDYEAGERLDV